MGTVAITGVAGAVGRRLVRALEDLAQVERVIGIDAEPSGVPASPKLQQRAADVRDPALAEALAGAETVVHLPPATADRDRPRARSVTVAGAQNVASAAAAVGADRLVHLSSAVVYGAHPDNAIPLGEGADLRANRDFEAAAHALEVEEWLWEWAQRRPSVSLTVLRPSNVAGPGVDNFVSRALEAPRLLSVRGHKPPLQFVHVDDVAAALAHVIDRELTGAYNVSAEGWLSFDEVAAIAGKRVWAVPEEVAFSLTDQLWRLGLSEYPAGLLHYFMHPWIVDVDRLCATGWRPRRSNRDALAAMVEEHGRYVALFGRRAQKSTLRTGALAVGGAAAAALAARALTDRGGDG